MLASYGVIPKEVKLTENFHFKKLEDGAKSWAEEIEKLSLELKRTDKNEIEKQFTEAGFNIDTEVKRLEKLLMEK